MLFRKISLLVLIVFSAAGVGKCWYSLKDGFSIRRIGAVLPVQDEALPFSEEWFCGPFHYLGRGRQCYAFESPDCRFVLKIPRFDRYEVPFIWKIPFSFLDEKRKAIGGERLKRRSFVLESFQIALRELREETALLYLHIGDTGTQLGKTELIDKLGRRYEIDLNRIVFALQEKKPLMMPQFLAAVERGDAETIDRIFDAFLDILKKRAELGIFNKDPSFMRNFAWCGEKGVQIDIGSFYRKAGVVGEEAFRVSMKESVGPIREWLADVDRDLLSRFDQRMEAVCVDLL